MPKLTKTFIDSIETPTKRTCYWDDRLPGFGLRVLPSGAKSFVIKYRVGSGGRKARQRWHTIGSYGTLTPQQARDEAQRLLAEVNQGHDPQSVTQSARQQLTLAELWDFYQQRHLASKAEATRQAYGYSWKYLQPAFGNWQLSAITRADVQDLHLKMKDTPYQANRTLAMLSSMFECACAWGFLGEGINPIKRVKRYTEEKKERFLSEPELVRLGAAVGDLEKSAITGIYAAAAIRLLLLTGARKNEIISARWADVDWERKLLRLRKAKTGKRDLYLSEAALKLLNDLQNVPTSNGQPFIIRGKSSGSKLVGLQKIWERVRRVAQLEDVRLHDLRHTAASIAAGSGMSLPIIGRLLGHTQAQTTSRYAHIGDDPAHAAAAVVGDVVAQSMGLKSAAAEDDSNSDD